MSGTLTFQWHTFWGRVNYIPASTIFPDEAAYCLHDSFMLTKAILKCQLDIFEKIDSVLASLQEQLRQEAEDDGNEGEGV